MQNSKKTILKKLIKLIQISEYKYKNGDFEGSLLDRMEAKYILESNTCDNEIRDKFKQELSKIFLSRFDLINDHKKRINEFKRQQIINLLEQKSHEKFQKRDFKGAIRALRRSEKYQ
tara:strand:- start:895 stop:1245 length:351 start_codon:yes stop_codon:yes gene_type:complete